MLGTGRAGQGDCGQQQPARLGEDGALCQVGPQHGPPDAGR